MWLTLGLLSWFSLVALVWTLEWQDQGKLTPLNAVFLMVVSPMYVAIAIYIAIALFSDAPSASEQKALPQRGDEPLPGTRRLAPFDLM
jgi:hypothetical protein